jgi:hypothetical protein
MWYHALAAADAPLVRRLVLSSASIQRGLSHSRYALPRSTSTKRCCTQDVLRFAMLLNAAHNATTACVAPQTQICAIIHAVVLIPVRHWEQHMTDTGYTVDDQFIGRAPNVRAVYDLLVAHLRLFGPIHEQPKKTSIHLANTSGFAGVHTRKNYVILNIRSDHPIDSPRIVKSEQVSKSRYHQEVKLQSPDDVDAELLAWLKAAYDLSS